MRTSRATLSQVLAVSWMKHETLPIGGSFVSRDLGFAAVPHPQRARDAPPPCAGFEHS